MEPLQEAERFYERMKHRMKHFGLSLAEEKSRLIEFGRFAETNRKKRGEGKIKKVNQILTGYFHYYGIIDNNAMNKKFRYNVLKSLFYWLNRRSQKKSTWVRFLQMIDEAYPIVEAKVYVNLFKKINCEQSVS